MADFIRADLRGSHFERVDRDARPSLDAVLELRRDRMSTVRRVIEGLTDESPGRHTEAVDAPGWPEPHSYPVRECLLIILNEEWEHRLVAERDLDSLASHPDDHSGIARMERDPP
jgi:DinB superfamily